MGRWNGFYIGVHKAHSGTTHTANDFKDFFKFNKGINLLAGYNIQSGSFLYGVDTDWFYKGYTESDQKKSHLIFHIRPRFGFALGDFLGYVAAGVGADIPDTNNRKFVCIGSVGIGIDAMLIPNLILRIEQRYNILPKIRDNDFTKEKVFTTKQQLDLAIAIKF